MFKPRFQITNRIAAALTDIERSRGFLEAATLSPAWVKKMQNQALVREAHYTTHIEGTQLTLELSEQLWQGKKLNQEVDPEDVKELLNYREAFDLVSTYVNDGEPITEGLIREIHKNLVQGVRGNSATPGVYRKIQNYVVNSSTQEIIYTPPAVYELAALMQALVDWLNDEEEVHPVLVSGAAQFQLVHVHPFLDGNGRTARLLSTLCLYRKGYDFKRLFTISEYYDRNRIDYYEAIQTVRQNNMDMTAWLEYFVEGLSTQMQEIKLIGKQAIKQDVLVKKHEFSERQRLAVEFMMQHGQLTIQNFEEICPDVSRRTLQRELRSLADKGLVNVSGATSNLIYKLSDEV